MDSGHKAEVVACVGDLGNGGIAQIHFDDGFGARQLVPRRVVMNLLVHIQFSKLPRWLLLLCFICPIGRRLFSDGLRRRAGLFRHVFVFGGLFLLLDFVCGHSNVRVLILNQFVKATCVLSLNEASSAE